MSGVGIVSVADPAHPTEAEGEETVIAGGAQRVFVADGVAYVSQRSRLAVVSVENPSQPFELAPATVGLRSDISVVGAARFSERSGWACSSSLLASSCRHRSSDRPIAWPEI